MSLIKICCLVWAAQTAAVEKIDQAHVVALVQSHRAAALDKWDTVIRELEDLNSAEGLPEDGILFVGSSSVRLWKSIEEDMAPWPVIRRGYGGAKFTDLSVFIDRLTKPIKFRALVIFVANDISGSDQDRTPQEVAELFKRVVQQVREHHPDQPIFYIAVTPTGSRFSNWSEISRSNQLIAEVCRTEPSLHFIATASEYLDEQGRPRDELFIKDRLHLNPSGYDLWASIIKQKLESVLGEP